MRWRRATLDPVQLLVAAAAELPLHRFDLGNVTLAVALEYPGFRQPDVSWRTVAPELADRPAPVGAGDTAGLGFVALAKPAPGFGVVALSLRRVHGERRWS